MIEEIEDQHSLVRSISLHSIAGVLITIFQICITPLLLNQGLTPEFGVLFGFIIIGEPF